MSDILSLFTKGKKVLLENNSFSLIFLSKTSYKEFSIEKKTKATIPVNSIRRGADWSSRSQWLTNYDVIDPAHPISTQQRRLWNFDFLEKRNESIKMLQRVIPRSLRFNYYNKYRIERNASNDDVKKQINSYTLKNSTLLGGVRYISYVIKLKIKFKF